MGISGDREDAGVMRTGVWNEGGLRAIRGWINWNGKTGEQRIGTSYKEIFLAYAPSPCVRTGIPDSGNFWCERPCTDQTVPWSEWVCVDRASRVEWWHTCVCFVTIYLHNLSFNSSPFLQVPFAWSSFPLCAKLLNYNCLFILLLRGLIGSQTPHLVSWFDYQTIMVNQDPHDCYTVGLQVWPCSSKYWNLGKISFYRGSFLYELH